MWVSRRRRRRKRIALAALTLCTGLCAAVAFREAWDQGIRRVRIAYIRHVVRPHIDPAEVTAVRGPGSLTGRRIYPHSVIPGGVRERSELEAAIAQDPVVRTHYADFDLGEAHLVRLNREKLVHVSYRVREKIYWTKKQVRLGDGEMLVSDGQNFARARCGNRVSVLAQEPTLPEEPTEEILETPIEPSFPELEPRLLAEEIQPMVLEEMPVTARIPDYSGLLDPVITGTTRYVVGPIPVSPPIFVYLPPNSNIPPAEVPEPATSLLIGSGFMAIVLLNRLLKKKE